MGEYEVRFEDALEDEIACRFTVAEYRLAPLVASMVQRQIADGKLDFTLRIEAFGSPVSGQVQLELTERGRRVTTARLEAGNGLVSRDLAISGTGSWSSGVYFCWVRCGPHVRALKLLHLR